MLILIFPKRSRRTDHKRILYDWYGSFLHIWATTWQNQQNEWAPSEDSDQPGHPPSLIRVSAVRIKKAWVLSYPLSPQQRLWSDWANAQADRSLCWAHTHFVGFVMSWLISSGRSSTCYKWAHLYLYVFAILIRIAEGHLILTKYIYVFMSVRSTVVSGP